MDNADERAAIVAELLTLGPVVPGTLSQRSTRCAGAGCRCRADPPGAAMALHPTWTDQRDGRHVTTTLSAEEGDLDAHPAHQRLHELVKQPSALGGRLRTEPGAETLLWA